MPGRGCPCDQLPVKILGTESLQGIRGGQHFTRVVTTCCWRNAHLLCDDTGQGALGARAWFPQTPPQAPLRCADCVLPSHSTALSTTLASPLSPPSGHGARLWSWRPGHRTPARRLQSMRQVDTVARAASAGVWGPGAAYALPLLPPFHRKVRKSLHSSPKLQTGNRSDTCREPHRPEGPLFDWI